MGTRSDWTYGKGRAKRGSGDRSGPLTSCKAVRSWPGRSGIGRRACPCRGRKRSPLRRPAANLGAKWPRIVHRTGPSSDHAAGDAPRRESLRPDAFRRTDIAHPPGRDPAGRLPRSAGGVIPPRHSRATARRESVVGSDSKHHGPRPRCTNDLIRPTGPADNQRTPEARWQNPVRRGDGLERARASALAGGSGIPRRSA